MSTKTSTTSGRNIGAELAYVTRTLEAPSLAAAVDRLAERTRAESWTHEEFLVACLQREVAARESHGGEARIRAARFPSRKALDESDFDHQRSLKRDTIAHLGTLDFVAAKENVVLLGPAAGRDHQTRPHPATDHRPMPNLELCRPAPTGGRRSLRRWAPRGGGLSEARHSYTTGGPHWR